MLVCKTPFYPHVRATIANPTNCNVATYKRQKILVNPSTRNPKITVTLIMQDLKYQMKIHFCKQPALRLDCNFMYVDMHA